VLGDLPRASRPNESSFSSCPSSFLSPCRSSLSFPRTNLPFLTTLLASLNSPILNNPGTTSFNPSLEYVSTPALSVGSTRTIAHSDEVEKVRPARRVMI
jgi:hypothetical protein